MRKVAESKMVMVEGGTWYCKQCGASFVWKNQLGYHQLTTNHKGSTNKWWQHKGWY